MPVVLFSCVNIAQEVVVDLRCVAQSQLGAPAVVPSAALFHLLYFRDIFLVRLDTAGLCQHDSFQVHILFIEFNLGTELLHLFCLNEILAHEVLLVLHIELSMDKPITVGIDCHVLPILKPSR